MMKRVSTAAARKDFASLVQASAGGKRVKLTRYNRTVAVMIPKSDLAVLEECEQRGARRRASGGGGR